MTTRRRPPGTTARTVWLHGSPSFIADGDWVVPAAELGGRSRTHPNGYGAAELEWYDPHRVYVFDSSGVDPLHHLDRSAFTRSDHFLYDVEPDGPVDLDHDCTLQNLGSATCQRARVLRCVHSPELPVISADLSGVAADGGRVRVSLADRSPRDWPCEGRRVVLRDDGLSKAGIVRRVDDDGQVLVDVVGDRVRPMP